MYIPGCKSCSMSVNRHFLLTGQPPADNVQQRCPSCLKMSTIAPEYYIELPAETLAPATYLQSFGLDIANANRSFLPASQGGALGVQYQISLKSRLPRLDGFRFQILYSTNRPDLAALPSAPAGDPVWDECLYRVPYIVAQLAVVLRQDHGYQITQVADHWVYMERFLAEGEKLPHGCTCLRFAMRW